VAIVQLTARRGLAITAVFLLLGIFSIRLSAQEADGTAKEVWPEFNAYVPLTEKTRLFFLLSISRSRETRSNTEGQVGAHLDYFRTKNVSFRGGYRYGFSLGASEPFREHRVISEETVRKTLKAKLLLLDRNRQDIRWVNGEFSVRLRNRLTLEREFKLNERSLTPYGSAEIFYDTRFNTFNRSRFTGGLAITLKKHERFIDFRKQTVLDIYYLRQNDTRSQPRHLNALGLTFAIYF
jgi:Protein of unknown function (DUF2490)